MRLLALETSGRSATAALLEGAEGPMALVDEQATPPGERSAQALLPTVHELLKRHGWGVRDLSAIAAAAGPGSFTGLRVGVVAAKTLAFALRIPLVGVNTLRVIAEQAGAADQGQRTWAVLDAQRGELFAAAFSGRDDALQSIHADDAGTKLIHAKAWLCELAPGDRVAGPPLDKLRGAIPAGVAMAPPDAWSPTAAGVGRVAVKALAAGWRGDALGLVPFYLRASAAEEKAGPAPSA